MTINLRIAVEGTGKVTGIPSPDDALEQMASLLDSAAGRSDVKEGAAELVSWAEVYRRAAERLSRGS